MFLDLKNVSKSFDDKSKPVLDNINLTIQEGEFVAIVGFTGSGKTTLVKLMAGLLTPDSGEILFQGNPIAGPGKDRGVVFQNYSLLPWFTVLQNVLLAVNEAHPEMTKPERMDHAKKYIAMGLTK